MKPRLGTLLLGAGAVAVVLAGARSRIFQLEPWLAPKEAALGLTALLLFPLLVARWRSIRLSMVDLLLCAFVAWSALSAALATNRWLALASLGVGVSGLVLYAAGRTLAGDGRSRGAVMALAAAASLGAALGVAQAYGLEGVWLAESRPPGGTFGNRNFLAHLAAIAMPLLLYLTLRERAPVALPAALGLAVTAMAIVLTRSRAAWLATAAAGAVMLLAVLLARGRPLRGRRVRVLAALVLLGAAVGAALMVPNRLQWRSEAPYADTLTRLADYRGGSGRGRLIQYANTLEMVKEHALLGVGPGNWFVHYPRYTTPLDPSYVAGDPMPTNPWPSSDWVTVAAERGVVGVLLLGLAGVAAAFTALRRLMAPEPVEGTRSPRGDVARGGPPEGASVGGGADLPGTPPRSAHAGANHERAAARERDATERARAMALLGVLAAATTTGLFDAVLLLAAPTYLVWGSLGLLLPESRPVVERPLGGGARAAVLTVGLLLLTAVAGYAGLRTAAVLVADPGSRASLRQAALLDPGGHRMHLHLAKAGSCRARLPHARRAAALLPHHDTPAQALRACGVSPSAR